MSPSFIVDSFVLLAPRKVDTIVVGISSSAVQGRRAGGVTIVRLISGLTVAAVAPLWHHSLDQLSTHI